MKTTTIETIAKEVLHLETLETRNSDSLDFRDQAVWNIKTALEQAYDAGVLRGMSEERRRQRSNRQIKSKNK